MLNLGSKLTRSGWFGDVYERLTTRSSVPTAALLRRALDYRIAGYILWIYRRETHLPCVPELEVLLVLRKVHDEAGHWGKFVPRSGHLTGSTDITLPPHQTIRKTARRARLHLRPPKPPPVAPSQPPEPPTDL